MQSSRWVGQNGRGRLLRGLLGIRERGRREVGGKGWGDSRSSHGGNLIQDGFIVNGNQGFSKRTGKNVDCERTARYHGEEIHRELFMTRHHVPSAKQEINLFKLRSNAHRNEVERRSQVNQTMDMAERAREEQDNARRKKDLAENGERWIHNSEETISRLVRESAAFNRAIVRMAEAWAPKGQDPIEAANAIVEEVVNELDNDQLFVQQVRVWSRAQIKNGSSVSNPKVKRPKP